MSLREAELLREYTVESVNVNDEQLTSFLFSLGCFSGEPITVIARRRSGCIVAIKDGRYSIDSRLAEAITVRE